MKTHILILVSIFTGLFQVSFSQPLKQADTIFKVKEVNQMQNGLKNGLWVELINEKDIQIANYILGKKEGNVITLYSDSVKSEFMYKNDKKNGKGYIYGIGSIEYIYENDSLIKTIIHSPSW
jgi:hypothetical protein